MAKSSSSVYGFYFRKSLQGVDQPVRLRKIIANSQTISVGDAVRFNTAGYIIVCAAGEPVLGVVDGIVDKDGLNVFSPRASGTTGATLTPDDTVAVSSTNQSDATRNIKVEIVVNPDVLFYNDANGDFAATNEGQLFDTTSTGDRIDQSSASDTSGQFQLLERDPDGDGDASKGLFRIAETQLLRHIGNSTTVVGA